LNFGCGSIVGGSDVRARLTWEAGHGALQMTLEGWPIAGGWDLRIEAVAEVSIVGTQRFSQPQADGSAAHERSHPMAGASQSCQVARACHVLEDELQSLQGAAL
jgi:hypothetical protein